MGSGNASIAQRVCGDCTVRKDDGVGYGDSIAQLTFLLFLEGQRHRSVNGGCFGVIGKRQRTADGAWGRPDRRRPPRITLTPNLSDITMTFVGCSSFSFAWRGM